MLVIGVLASIAGTSFLGSRNNAYDKEAQASVSTALTAASILYSNQGDFSDASSAQCGDSVTLAADLQKIEPGIDFITSSASSTNPQLVSVTAGQTFSSNAELLGCQVFYATAFSRSGSCWIGRMTVEGKFLGPTSTLPIQMASVLNTQNSAATTFTLLQINGKAYAYVRGRSTGADADNTNGLAAIGAACNARTQGTGSVGTTANIVKSTEFYNSFKDVQASANGSNS